MILKFVPHLLLLTLFSLFAACNKAETSYYEVPKEKVAEEVSQTQLPAGHPPISEVDASSSSMGSLPGFQAPRNQTELQWSVPEGWVEGSASSVRIASFVLEGSDRSQWDFAVTRFPGDVGGLFSNVNRWRSQLGLAPYTTEAEARADEERVANEAFEFSVFRMANTANPPLATEVAILELKGFSWFFKVTGVQQTVESESARFRDFLRSIQPGSSDS